jgi:hypothetical protein
MKTAAQPEGQRRYHPAGQLRFDLDLASTCQLALKKHCKYRISRNAFDWQNHNDLTIMTWHNAALLRKWDCLSSIPIATNKNGQQSWPHFSPIGRQD